jgi:hypothetical protein
MLHTFLVTALVYVREIAEIVVLGFVVLYALSVMVLTSAIGLGLNRTL